MVPFLDPQWCVVVFPRQVGLPKVDFTHHVLGIAVKIFSVGLVLTFIALEAKVCNGCKGPLDSQHALAQDIQ